MKCSSCGHWNRIPVNKIFIERPSPEPKVKLYVPMYEPLEVVNYKKCWEYYVELQIAWNSSVVVTKEFPVKVVSDLPKD